MTHKMSPGASNRDIIVLISIFFNPCQRYFFLFIQQITSTGLSNGVTPT